MVAGDFQWDVFISYASSDDDLPTPLHSWVSRFQSSVKCVLTHLLGREVKIYFDKRVAEANHTWSHIEEACLGSRVFVAVVSPSYILRESGWPMREFELFRSKIDDERRLFIVRTAAAERTERADIKERVSVNFFEKEAPNSRPPMPLKPDDDPFIGRIWDLCGSIAAQLQRMVAKPDAPPTAVTYLGPVLVAQATDDLDEERAALARYLRQAGVEVLPTADYPGGGSEFAEAFRSDLRRARLVVQLLGPHAGRRPADLPEGYVRHQYEAGKASGLPVMQWRSSALAVEACNDLDHRALLIGETVTASTLEQFKGDVIARVQPHLEETPAREGAAHSETIIFINAERSDADIAIRLMDELGDDYAVWIPRFDAAGSNQKDYRKKLASCDALLVVYGMAGPAWLEDTMLHAVKVRRGRMPFGAICLGPPPDKAALTFRIPGIEKLDCTAASGDKWQLDRVKELMAQRTC